MLSSFMEVKGSWWFLIWIGYQFSRPTARSAEGLLLLESVDYLHRAALSTYLIAPVGQDTQFLISKTGSTVQKGIQQRR